MVARYLNGLRYNIQAELSLTTPRTVEECYKLAMKVEDKLKRKQDKQNKGRDKSFRGRGSFGGRGHSSKSREESSNNQEQNISQKGNFRGRRPNGRGRFGGQGRGSNTFSGRFYKCNQFGHQAWKCPKTQSSTSHDGEKRTKLVHEKDNESVNSPSQHADLEIGESLMMRRTLIKVPTIKEPPQRKQLFRTTCK